MTNPKNIRSRKDLFASRKRPLSSTRNAGFPGLLVTICALVSLAFLNVEPANANEAASSSGHSQKHKQKQSHRKKQTKQTRLKAIWGPPELNGVSQFPVYRDLGVGIYQTAVAWSDIAPVEPADPTNPTDPSYRWPSGLDATIKEAQRYDMKVMVMVIGAPPWANGGRDDRAWAPQHPSDYARFMTAAAKKYKSVHMWMVWGEPNRSPNFKPLSPSRTGPLNRAQAQAPRIYGEILDAAYGALKRVNRKNTVIGGNTFTAAGGDSISAYQWIRYMRLPNGRMPRMDLYGHNPYSFRIPNLHSHQSAKGRVDFSDLGRLARKLDKYYPGKKMKIFVSEFGVPAGGVDAELGFGLNKRVQAKWIRAAFKVERKFKRIYTIGWIHPFDIPSLGITTGLMDENGKRKPGYKAFRAG